MFHRFDTGTLQVQVLQIPSQEILNLLVSYNNVSPTTAYCNCTISPQQREEIMSFFYGHVRRLIRHTEAASLLELAYNDYANAHQREALTREFYGVIVSVIVVLRI